MAIILILVGFVFVGVGLFGVLINTVDKAAHGHKTSVWSDLEGKAVLIGLGLFFVAYLIVIFSQ